MPFIRFALFVLLLSVCMAQASIAAGFKFPQLTGRVTDQAGVLSSGEEQQLTTLLADQDARTGNQVVVATVASLQGRTIEDYSLDLAQAWKVGQKDRNNGIILLVAPNQRKVRIEVGIGLERAITDAIAKRIIEEKILPRFRINDIGGGIIQGTHAILLILDGETLAPAITNRGFNGSFLLFLIGVALLIGFSFYMKRHRRRKRRYGRLLDSGRHVRNRHHRNSGQRTTGSSSNFSGGGFSGGGGSFGGGGASGGW